MNKWRFSSQQGRAPGRRVFLRSWLVTCFILLVVIGVCDASSSGPAYAQDGPQLVGTGGDGNTNQGSSISLSSDGNTVLVGMGRHSEDIGGAWVFVRDPVDGTWSQQGPRLQGDGGVANSEQGWSVALSGDGNTALIGGREDASSVGASWVFVRNSSNLWEQQGQKLVGSNVIGTSRQGSSVALSGDGNTALVGGPAHDNFRGAVWVFVRVNDTWTEEAHLVAVVEERDGFGAAVALSGDGNTAVIGCPGFTTDLDYEGGVFIFVRTGGVWAQQGNILIGTDRVGLPSVGGSVSISTNGHVVLAGGASDDDYQGAAWVFTRDNETGVWSQLGHKLVGTGAIGDVVEQGSTVSLSGDGKVAIIGSSLDDDSKGAFWVFQRSGEDGNFTQVGPKITVIANSNRPEFASSAATSYNGKIVLVGARKEIPPDPNGVGVFEEGATFVFLPRTDAPTRTPTFQPSQASQVPTASSNALFISHSPWSLALTLTLSVLVLLSLV